MEAERGTTTEAKPVVAGLSRNGQQESPDGKSRVALFLPSLVHGGAERVTLNIAEGLVRHGATVDLVLSSATGAYMEQIPHGVNLIDLGSSRVLTSLPGLVRYLRSRRPDVLLSALAHTNVVALWAKSLARTQTRVVVAVHSTLSLSTRHSPRRRDRLVPWLTNMFYRNASHVVAVSSGSARDLVELTRIDPDLVEVIPNPVITDRLLAKAKESVEMPWPAEAGKPILITVGRLTAAKNYGLLLRSFARLRTSLDARLLILGEGEERKYLEQLIEELDLAQVVAMPGYVDNPYAYMRGADLFVLSSRWEGLPTVLVEALTLGLPVVSTDCEFGPRELLRDGDLGTLVPVDDEQALATGMVVALERGAARLEESDLDDFRMETAVSRYRELLLNGHS